ncbi:hypothetical protein HID58_022916, partial [Brassica napus]
DCLVCHLPASFKTSAQNVFHLLSFSLPHGEEKTTQKPSLSKKKKTRLKRSMTKKCLHEGTKPNLQLNSGKSERLFLLSSHQIKLGFSLGEKKTDTENMAYPPNGSEEDISLELEHDTSNIYSADLAHKSWLVLAKEEERFLFQRSHINWTQGGDCNSSYYNRLIATRKSFNHIHFLINNQ